MVDRMRWCIHPRWRDSERAPSAAGEIRTPDPLVRSQVLSSAELRRRVVRISMPRLRREVSAAPRARRRTARDLCVVRRRRDVAAGAPSSGSRVILCPLHHATPADGAPRCCIYCMCCVFLPRPSVVKQPSTRCARSGRHTARHPERRRGICTSPSLLKRKRPTCSWRRWGVSNRSDPVMKAMRYGASPRNPDPAPP